MSTAFSQNAAAASSTQQVPASQSSLRSRSNEVQRREVQHTEKVVQECIGYKRHGHRRCLYVVLVVCSLLTCGLFWLAVRAMPSLAVRFLSRCPLAQASFVLVKLINGRTCIVKVQRYTMSSSYSGLHGTHTPEAGAGRPKLRIIKLFLRQYAYCPEHDKFEAIPAVPAQIPDLICRALHSLSDISQGADWEQFNSKHAHNRRNMVQLYGNKKWLFRRDQVMGAAARHALPTIFTIQITELIYLLYRGYYAYALVLQTISLVAVGGLLAALHDQHGKLVGLVNQKHMVPVVQRGWVRAASSHQLVPGDVVVLQRGKATCDMVLLRGSCLVEESMLSGEAAQVRKSAYVVDGGSVYHPDSYNECTVFAGTVVRQVWNVEDPEEEVLAMVVRVKLDTTMGSMVRQLIAPVAAVQEKEPFEADVMRLYLFSLILQLLIIIPYIMRAHRFAQTPRQIIHRVLDMLVHAAPPAIPGLMLMCGFAVTVRLRRRGIKLMFPEVLKRAAAMEVICFDKTGTLTGSMAEWHGAVPVTEGSFEPLQQITTRWSNRLKQAAAVCHGLTWVNRTLIVGEEMEQRLFKAVEARFKDRDTVVMPRKPDSQSDARTVVLHILRVLEFSSQTLRSGVVVQSDDTAPDTALLFLRGAPGVMKKLVLPSSLPADFDKVIDDYSSQSFRLMAVAVGVIPGARGLTLHHMSPQQIEGQAKQLELLALLVLTNHVRHDSKSTVSELHNEGAIRTMMITGDYHHTAIAVAKDVGMLSHKHEVIIIDLAKPSQPPNALPAQRTAYKPQLAESAQQRQSFESDISAQQRQSFESAKTASTAGSASDSKLPSDHFPTSSSLVLPDTVSSDSTRPAAHLTPADGHGQPSSSDPVTKAITRMPTNVMPSHDIQGIPSSPGHDTLPRPRSMSASSRKVSFHLAGTLSHVPEERPHGFLTFVRGLGGTTLGPVEALTALTSGQAQCAVTGDAFQQMLQASDLSVLECVVRNSVVFARMKPHQKGQVMDLLSVRGLHQMHYGLPRHIKGLGHMVMFCGDGINDLAALRAADIGYAVGITDATVAASLSTSYRSVAGVSSFIKEGKAGHSLILSLFKYMVVYQCLKSAAENIAFFMDGSSFDYLQDYTLDFQALSMAFAATICRPLRSMSRHQPPSQVGIWQSYVLVTVMVTLFLSTDVFTMWYLTTRSWYTGGNGTAKDNAIISQMWTTANFQLLGPIISLTVDTRLFVQPIFHTVPLLSLAVAFTVLANVIILAPRTKGNLLALYQFPQEYRFRVEGFAVAAVVYYYLFVTLTRHGLRWFQQRRVQPS